MSEQKVSVGRIVHYVLPDGRSAGEVRPLMVVRVWNEHGTVNGQLFTDCTNDGDAYKENLAWRTSVAYSEEKLPGTWHWPPRV